MTKTIIECECGEATGDRCAWSGPVEDTVLVEWMPEYLRASHEAAGNWGRYPHNGAVRLRLESSCAELHGAYDDVPYCLIVED